jgi:predicted HAD superfamily Cof-like phosphohydrolase
MYTLSTLTERILRSADLLGIDIVSVFNEVHASNMSKLGDDGRPIYREDGKVLKGPNYRKPDLSKFVEDREDIAKISN